MPPVTSFLQPSLWEFGPQPALQYGDATHTYEALDRSFSRVANALIAIGLGRGDHSAIMQYNSDRWIQCEGGQAKAGIATVPINQRLSPAEVAYQLDNSEAKAVIFRPDGAALVEQIRGDLATCRHFLCIPDGRGPVPDWATDFDELLVEATDDEPPVRVRLDDRFRLMYTSATTGSPKAVVVTHERFAAHITTTLVNQLRDVRAGDRYLAVTPFTHMAIGFVWPFLARGGTVVTVDHWDAEEFLRLCAERRITHAILAPTLIIDLLGHIERRPELLELWRRSAVRAIWYAASPIPVAVARQAEKTLGPVLNQMYGLTEIIGNGNSMTCTELTSEWHARKPETCGRVQLNNAVRVVDESRADVPVGEVGEVIVMAHHNPVGYWKNPKGTAETIVDGWIHTGDMGRFDDEGFLTIVDRKKDMIISGGFNIYPLEIENVIQQHPAVRQCAVIGISDPRWVETPCAFVVCKQGTAVDGDELVEFVRERIAHFKVPKQVIFTDELPVSATGKVLKRALRERLPESAQR